MIERPTRPGVETWNGAAADGWVALRCADETNIQIAHRVPDRSSLAFAPLRERGGVATIAPLGTLWGEGAWHDPRVTGGSGVEEIATWLVGSQFRPAAPDWAGQRIRYRLLVDAAAPAVVLDAFAHPPVVTVESP